MSRRKSYKKLLENQYHVFQGTLKKGYYGILEFTVEVSDGKGGVEKVKKEVVVDYHGDRLGAKLHFQDVAKENNAKLKYVGAYNN